MPIDPRTPVLIGSGQVNHYEDGEAPDPVGLIALAARQAAEPRVLEAVDAIRVVNILSWRYRDPGLLLGEAIGAADYTTHYSGVGGNVPQSLVNQACLDIQRGTAEVVLIGGGERWRTRMRLRADGRKPDWPQQVDAVPVPSGGGDDVPLAGPAEQRIELVRPAHVYPLFEQALRIAAGESSDDHRRRIGALWSQFSAVAEGNPYAWSRKRLSAEEISQAAPNQLAVHQVDELQQHGRPGRRRNLGIRTSCHPIGGSLRQVGIPLRGNRFTRHIRARRASRLPPLPGHPNRRAPRA